MMPARLSRRTLLGAIPGLTLAAPAAAQVTGTRIIVPDAPEEEPSTLDAWVDKYGRPTAKVMLNGLGPYNFMVDTGSTTTVLAERHVSRLKLSVVGMATVAGTTGTAETSMVKLDTLETGVVRTSDIRLAVLPDAGLARADGILAPTYSPAENSCSTSARGSSGLSPLAASRAPRRGATCACAMGCWPRSTGSSARRGPN